MGRLDKDELQNVIGLLFPMKTEVERVEMLKQLSDGVDSKDTTRKKK